ncbi:hypothetical protein QBC41DRAFT_335569 [Cercophora samala]|uniref:tyrosinase n=1 Tax=Cercophora samala TaxID=330535 RepID=A0AA39ZHB9_9PEZI|nr:hypothetical protein QBC41DRAFT_335569 [Cercophora samala]
MSTTGNIAITGIPTKAGSDGSFPLRRELRDLQRKYPDHFNLLVLALKDFQALNESVQTSYYQIAGIHGLPYKPWNGVGSSTDWQSTSGFGGYCTHSSILFLTWHRPYLALFEQALYTSIQKIANQFPEGTLRTKYVEAAKTFRMPYFDWASQPPSGSSAFPSAFTTPNLQVVDIDGKTKSTANPIYRFVFHPVNPSPGNFPTQWSRYPTTVRYPNPRTGQSQDNRVAPILANELASLRTNVSLLLLSYTNFDAFSFNRWDPSTNPGEFGSLEDVHNEIHDRTGGGGHMSSLDVSSFDPLFWFHHTNVDRLWAIWQDLNPDNFLSPRPAPYSTFNSTQGESQTKDTPLTPFWDKSATKFWTSEEIKDTTTTFGYAYPETQEWKYKVPSEYQASIRQAVTSLYGTNVFANFAAANVQARATEHTQLIKSLSLATHPPSAPLTAEKPLLITQEMKASPIPESLQHLAPNNKYPEWVVNIRAQKHGLHGAFRVIVFLGAIDESDPDSWQTEFNAVGRVSVLGRSTQGPATTKCAKCVTDAADELMISGTVPLTSALLQDIVNENTGLQSLQPEEVVPYLKKELKWKVTMFETGEEKNCAEVPGLKVSVTSTEVTIGEDGLPDYSGQYVVYPEITDGKPGGLRDGEHI